MEEREHQYFWPTEKNLGKNCKFWSQEDGCTFPKREIERRRSCDGMVDDVCLFLKNGRPPQSLTSDQILELRTRVPNSPLDIPPGEAQVQTSPITQPINN